MVNQYEATITAFEEKLRKLMSAYRSLQTENASLKEELERKHRDLMEAHRDVLTLQKDYNELRIARGLSGNDEERKTAQESITKLIREIDKCLALLTY